MSSNIELDVEITSDNREELGRVEADFSTNYGSNRVTSCKLTLSAIKYLSVAIMLLR